jgi:hypothetical protein
MPYTETTEYEKDPNNTTRSRRKRRGFRLKNIGPAFWTIASLVSLTVNIILVVVLILLARPLFSAKGLVEQQVLGGLYQNFVEMDQAHIRTTIPVNTQVPAKFDLPLNTTTEVTLAEDTTITNATIYDLNAGALYISRATTSIILPKGSRLPINLNLTVPVDQQIPVNLMVDVDIPLSQTELHKPFAGLQEVVKPYYTYLTSLPNSWQEALCGDHPSSLCRRLVH